jgi:hypothetical protein
MSEVKVNKGIGAIWVYELLTTSKRNKDQGGLDELVKLQWCYTVPWVESVR